MPPVISRNKVTHVYFAVVAERQKAQFQCLASCNRISKKTLRSKNLTKTAMNKSFFQLTVVFQLNSLKTQNKDHFYILLLISHLNTTFVAFCVCIKKPTTNPIKNL